MISGPIELNTDKLHNPLPLDCDRLIKLMK